MSLTAQTPATSIPADINNPDWLREQYEDHRLSVRRIAQLAHCGQDKVRARMAEFHIAPRKTGPVRRPELADPKWLTEHYLTRRLSAAQIAAELDCDRSIVVDALHDAGIPVRDRAANGHPQLHDKNWLQAQYVTSGRSTSDIAAELSAEPSSVRAALRRHEIPLRPRGSEPGQRTPYRQLEDKDWLHARYVDDGLSILEITRLVGARTVKPVGRALRRHNIPARPPGRRRALHNGERRPVVDAPLEVVANVPARAGA